MHIINLFITKETLCELYLIGCKVRHVFYHHLHHQNQSTWYKSIPNRISGIIYFPLTRSRAMLFFMATNALLDKSHINCTYTVLIPHTRVSILNKSCAREQHHSFPFLVWPRDLLPPGNRLNDLLFPCSNEKSMTHALIEEMLSTTSAAPHDKQD